MQKKLIIFDMDGTLVDSSVTIANAINHVRHNLELPSLNPVLIIEKVNDHTLNPAQYFYETDHFEVHHEEWFSEYYTNNHDKELILYAGIGKLLQALKGEGLSLAVATNAYRGSTIESLTHLGIYDLFDAIACFDDVEHGKPFPDMLYKILEELDIPSKDTLFIGDGPRDHMAAKRASIDYLMVNWGFSDHQEAIHSVKELKSQLLP
ncbi:MAG: HAD family hydrolase [Campylobacterota bacterium]|nr:HAD family hydrolase [Campylobacterota bacterium]